MVSLCNPHIYFLFCQFLITDINIIWPQKKIHSIYYTPYKLVQRNMTCVCILLVAWVIISCFRWVADRGYKHRFAVVCSGGSGRVLRSGIIETLDSAPCCAYAHARNSQRYAMFHHVSNEQTYFIRLLNLRCRHICLTDIFFGSYSVFMSVYRNRTSPSALIALNIRVIRSYGIITMLLRLLSR